MLFKISRRVIKYLGYFCKSFWAKNFQKSSNLVTLASLPLFLMFFHTHLRVALSVTRLGDLLDFGQLFEAFGNN